MRGPGLQPNDNKHAFCHWQDVVSPELLLQKLQGEVFAYDKQTNLVVIKQPGTEPNRHNLQFLKTAHIKASTEGFFLCLFISMHVSPVALLES